MTGVEDGDFGNIDSRSEVFQLGRRLFTSTSFEGDSVPVRWQLLKVLLVLILVLVAINDDYLELGSIFVFVRFPNEVLKRLKQSLAGRTVLSSEKEDDVRSDRLNELLRGDFLVAG